MINRELLDRVRYPDETDGLYFDTLDYNEVLKVQRFFLVTAKGQDKIDIQETLDELERRWEDRQSKIRWIDIPTRKIVNTI